MKMRLAVLLAIATVVLAASGKDRVWQVGNVLDTRSNKYFPATDGVGENDKALSSRMFADPQAAATGTVYDHYVVESADAVYLVERGRFRSIKPLELRPYNAVKFSVDKKKIWLLDESGKQQEALILKRVDKDVATPSITAGLPAR